MKPAFSRFGTITVAVLLISLAGIGPVDAAFDPSTVALSLVRVAGGFDSPLLVTNAGDGSGRLFVVEQGGRIRTLRAGSIVDRPFLDIGGRISSGGERGLLGLAFHPAYETNGRLYVDYTDRNGNTVISEFTAIVGQPDIADPGSERVLLRIPQPYANHNGGALAFGPDGFLYIATGDGGSAGDPGNRAQSLATRLGKILRIDVDSRTGNLRYGVPRTNPFVGRYGVDEIWAYGLRNPWRFSFDRATGDLWIGDVGQSRWEEINRATRSSGGGRGRNYGWRVMEGRVCHRPAVGCSTSGKTAPVAVYSHSVGCSVTGGHVYRGCAMPDLRGTYFYADFCSAFIRTFRGIAAGHAQQRADRTATLNPGDGLAIENITSFGEDGRGELYIADHNGEIFKIVPEE
jgi:glucose/arabinose dehydrogenase